MLVQPLTLHCNAVVCTKCITDYIATSASTQCPCCEDSHELTAKFSAAAPALQLRTLLHTKTICLEQSSVKGLFNFSTMIVGESNPLPSSLVEENERCSKKIAELVSGMHFGIWIICTL